jgi:hypothetical protein
VERKPRQDSTCVIGMDNGCTPWWFGLTRNKQACIRASIIPSQRWFPDSPFRHKIIRSLSINRANSAFGSKIEISRTCRRSWG